MGMQSPKIVVVQDKQTRDYLSELNAKYLGSDSDPFYGAPTVLVVLASKERPTCVEDGSLVMGNLMNAAYAVGMDPAGSTAQERCSIRKRGKRF